MASHLRYPSNLLPRALVALSPSSLHSPSRALVSTLNRVAQALLSFPFTPFPRITGGEGINRSVMAAPSQLGLFSAVLCVFHWAPRERTGSEVGSCSGAVAACHPPPALAMDSYSLTGVDQCGPLVAPAKLLSLSSALQQQSRVELCRVCASPHSASPHFGTVSCLACAAFFRRTVALNITFHCKKMHDCPIYYELRMICRACRYDKCIHAGMKRQCVQKRRPNSKKMKDDPDGDFLSDSSSAFSAVDSKQHLKLLSMVKAEPISPEAVRFSKGLDDSPSDDDNDGRPGEDLLAQPHSSSVDSFTDEDPSLVPSTSFASLHKDHTAVDTESTSSSNPYRVYERLGMTGPELLSHFVVEEKKAMDRRRMMFSPNPAHALQKGDGTVPYLRDDLQAHTLRAQVENVKFDHLLGYEYTRAMPAFEQLDERERLLLYRVAALGFSVTDIGFISAQVIGDNDEMLVFPDGTYSTCGEGDFSVGWDDEDIITHDDKKNLFRDFNTRFFSAVIRPFRQFGLDQVEHAALKALCSWKLGYYEYTTKMKQIAFEMQSGIFEGLHEYYGDRDDKEIRIGNIVLIMATIFDMFKDVTEMYKQLEIFNLLKVDAITKCLLTI